jgi:hypothetical protein
MFLQPLTHLLVGAASGTATLALASAAWRIAAGASPALPRALGSRL